MHNSLWVGGSIGRRGFPMLGTGKRGLSTYIKDIFKNGEQGFFYDPNDLSTMWQDQAKLLPVTGAGQPVWHILDKSGNNNHAFATSSATRPILRQNAITGAYYLAFDGADDFLVTNNIDFTATNKVTTITAINTLGSTGCVLETGTNVVNTNGTFGLFRGGKLQFGARGTVYRLINMGDVALPEVLVAKADIENAKLSVYKNRQPFSTMDQSLGLGNFGNYPLYIGRRAGTSLAFNGHIYSLIGIGRLTTDSETAALEKAIAKNTGVTLNV